MTDIILAESASKKGAQAELILECRTGKEEWNGISPVESNANEAHGKQVWKLWTSVSKKVSEGKGVKSEEEERIPS